MLRSFPSIHITAMGGWDCSIGIFRGVDRVFAAIFSPVPLSLCDPAPQVFLAEEEKIIVEETQGNETVVEEK